jgi:hypothetical protein
MPVSAMFLSPYQYTGKYVFDKWPRARYGLCRTWRFPMQGSKQNGCRCCRICGGVVERVRGRWATYVTGAMNRAFKLARYPRYRCADCSEDHAKNGERIALYPRPGARDSVLWRGVFQCGPDGRPLFVPHHTAKTRKKS